jgi:hypothetical protein
MGFFGTATRVELVFEETQPAASPGRDRGRREPAAVWR